MNDSPQDWALIWAGFGVLLILAELLVPGLLSIFLGMGAIAVGGLVWYGGIVSLWGMFTSWFVISLFLLLVVRTLVLRWLPGETEVGEVDEDREALGKIVDVQKLVTPQNAEGRIFYRGTTWEAQSVDHHFYPGQKARIVSRKGMIWIVDKIS